MTTTPKRPPRLTVRQHVLSPQHGLDRVKLSCQIGPLGGIDRPVGELLASLWNKHHGHEETEMTTEKPKEVWIVKGEVTSVDAHPTAVLGQTEWQFSDGPSGHRGYSSDHLCLEEGLAAHSGCVIHWEG